MKAARVQLRQFLGFSEIRKWTATSGAGVFPACYGICGSQHASTYHSPLRETGYLRPRAAQAPRSSIGSMPGWYAFTWRPTRTGRFANLPVSHCSSPTDTENVAKVGVGSTGEIDARNRHSCVGGINGQDSLVDLEITMKRTRPNCANA